MDKASLVEIRKKNKAKLLRANGECLGVKRRRRTWLTAISFGEL